MLVLSGFARVSHSLHPVWTPCAAAWAADPLLRDLARSRGAVSALV